ncbi:hypothetical protein ACWEKS_48730, partial [Nocardia sp. NPDC004711]
LDSRAVVLQVRVRRLVCLTSNCCKTFREQVPGVLDRYQRRTTRMTHQVRSVVREGTQPGPGCPSLWIVSEREV